MEHFIKIIIERAARFRNQLIALEKKMAGYLTERPPELWQELVTLSNALEVEEKKARAALEIKTRQVNETREAVRQKLAEYNQWREQMREVDALFLANIVRPGYRLKQAVRQRTYLVEEYKRIRREIETGDFAQAEEVEAEVHRTLTHGEAAYTDDRESFEDEVLAERELSKDFPQFDVDDLVDAFEKDHLVRDFKRFVLPSVHPDTSDTDMETFKTVFEVYEKKDYVLMAAYVAEYRGELAPDPQEDLIGSLERACQLQDQYQAILARLERRVDYLVKDLTPEELKDPEAVRNKMLAQRDEIRDRIQAETELILHWREMLENLVKFFRERFSGGDLP
jgi:hypothetical protein